MVVSLAGNNIAGKFAGKIFSVGGGGLMTTEGSGAFRDEGGVVGVRLNY